MDRIAGHALRMEVGTIFLLSAMVFAARLLEVSFPVEPDAPRRQVWLDYKLVAMCIFLPWSLSALTGFTSAALISTIGGGIIHLRSQGWWFLPSLLIYLVALDFYKYWMHRLEHAVPWLWRIHSFHHSAKSMTFITGARHHWLDAVINGGFFPLFPIIFQTPPEILFVGTAISFLPDTCAHLNVRLSLGRYALLLNNPQFHRIHHSTEPRHFNKNFAPFFPVWDVLFGTAWRPAPDEFPSTGLSDGDKPRSVWEGVIWPFRRPPILAAELRELASQQGQR